MSDQQFLPARRRGRRLLAVAAAITALIGTSLAQPAQASSVTSASFSGGSGTVTAGGAVYAKQGGALTLTVNTTADTKCVDVAGAFSSHQTSATAKSTWTFSTTAGTGNGVQAVTATASNGFNGQGKCTGPSGSSEASYTLDNTGPTLAAALSPAPNAAGWNKANTSITWAAADSGSGIGSGPAPATDSVTTNTAGVLKTATAADRLGNAGDGSVLVKLDKTGPTISGTSAPAPNASGWNNTDVTVSLTCTDALSGIKSCSGGGSVVLTTEGANQSVPGTAIDNADNAASTSLSGINIDKTAPSLSGTPTTAANADGWYNSDVAIKWTAADALSGLATAAPANSTITGEGTGLKATASTSDKAGNSTTADSSAVKIDRTAPITALSGTSNAWSNGDVTVDLAASDNLSGLASTSYAIDGGAPQTGTAFTLSSDGDHTVTFFSTDKAGNAETPQTAHVKIDKTAPTIGHTFAPQNYTDGSWTNQDVTVTFECADTGSGVAACTAPVSTSTEAAGQQIVGTAKDQAGNSASDTAVVSIDKTAPTITAAPDRAANDNGWYNDDVTVTYTASDSLSGVASTSPAKVLGEGTNQSATGTATDAAGNSASDTAVVSVDKTAPVLTASFASGWHTDDVLVTWSCTDARSGVATGPADETVTGEGDDLSSTATCTDRAGNQATKTVSGIKIDRNAAATSATVPAPLASGWYAEAVQVTLTGNDPLSGVSATYYSVDGGAAQSYGGPFAFATKGTHTITYWSKDVAGNTEDQTGNSITLKIDGNAPVTTVINPISPASGWFVISGIPVAFDANDAESGIAATYYQLDGGDVQTYGGPFTEELATGNHSISYWSVDLAGNAEAKQTTLVKVDTIAPAITGTRSPAPNAHGWNNTSVDVKFICTDADSGIDGIAGCGPDTTVSSEGADQSVQGDTQDTAGNANSTTVGSINIDKTAPSLTGTATTDPNGAGWYTGDVKIAWSADDGLSGVETQPADSTITGEGSNLGTTASVTDKAGNQKAASVNGIKIDRTAPVVNGGPTTSPNAAGWYRDQVVVDFTCTDNLSGIAFCPTSKIISGDGANQSVTSDPAGDKAGNDGAGKTVSGINLDGTAPSTTANNQCTKVNGYCTGPTASVVLSANDGLSGVKELHYKIDGGSEQTAAGASKTVSVPLDGSGSGTVTYWAVDNAGNAETANSVALKWDNIAPTVTHTVSPAPNANDWNKSDATVTFTAKDDDAGSGVASTSAPVTVSTETSGQAVTGSATDTAGNVGTDSVTIRLDKTEPVITAAIVSGTKGTNGWYVGPVGVHFTCSDSLSGVATCPDDVTLTDNGANTATGTATDKAGNSATATLPGITIDKESPTITNVNVAGGFFVLGAVPAATCTASDSYSGLAGCTVTVTGGTPNGVGTFAYTATATDKAGNKVTTSGTYKVVYRFDGYLQPINDTAHQVGLATSVFKAGSTVPAKFQLKKADGTVVPANTAPAWLTPVKGSSMSLPVDESVYSASSDSGSTYRYDASAQQYIYNWKTGAGGNYYRIGVSLDDGQSYTVNIGLRN
ncbi:hypothetical protein EV646_106107 [Kribbella antiqua]|uniref:Ig-like domain-containing protein n=1 Tax=Kribbella antiqua TaxID=2512217 RepID=A0A4R2IS08_9ACTN|nr:PxKF domain-containing protein [Kribbella antiqua]TCO46868.1 hypothetical protein EV646_106107 [Kribbella antiqua]